MTTENIQFIEVSKLIIAKENARRSPTTDLQDQELKASIASAGILQNLVVQKINGSGEKFSVSAGSRRLKALQELIKGGQLDKSFRVPCQVLNSSMSAEASIAENTCRAPMHELDELEAYARLIESNNYTVDDLVKHFGRPLKQIQKTLALASVAPKIREACRLGKLDVDDLQAFTVTKDHKRQLEAFKACSQGRFFQARKVKELLTDSAVESSDKLARFVGLQVYKKAGGKTSEDLFTGSVYLEDSQLLQKLKTEKLEKAVKKLGDGWGFITIMEDTSDWQIQGQYKQLKASESSAPAELLGQLSKVQSDIVTLKLSLNAAGEASSGDMAKLRKEKNKALQSLAKLEKRLEKHKVFTEKDRAKGGCIVAIDHSGTLRTYQGLHKGKAGSKSVPGKGPGTSKEKGYSQTIIDDLLSVKLHVCKAGLITEPSLGMDLIGFSLLQSLNDASTWVIPLKLSLLQTGGLTTDKVKADCIAVEEGGKALAQILSAAESILEEVDLPSAFRAYRDLSDIEKQAIYAAAASFALESGSWGRNDGMLDYILAESERVISEHWTPAAENYFCRIPKPMALTIGAEIFNDGAWPAANEKKSRKELAALLEAKVKATRWTPKFSA